MNTITNTPVTLFCPQHSGGVSKETYENIYIEASEEEAIAIFHNRFGHDPQRVSCTCCGEDYAVYEYENIEEASSFRRQQGAREKTVEEYLASPSVLFIRAADVTPDERLGAPEETTYEELVAVLSRAESALNWFVNDEGECDIEALDEARTALSNARRV